MENIQVNINLLRDIIKQSVIEAIEEERMNLYLSLLPKVSKKEMKEIEEKYGNPNDFNSDNFDDLSDLLRNAS